MKRRLWRTNVKIGRGNGRLHSQRLKVGGYSNDKNASNMPANHRVLMIRVPTKTGIMSTLLKKLKNLYNIDALFWMRQLIMKYRMCSAITMARFMPTIYNRVEMNNLEALYIRIKFSIVQRPCSVLEPTMELLFCPVFSAAFVASPGLLALKRSI
jgi:hypothetical protein